MSHRRLACSALLPLLVLVGCGGAPEGPAGPPSPKQLAEAAYAGIYDEPVQLRHGRFEGEPFVPGGASRPTVRLLAEPMAVGELDGAEGPEAAVLLAEDSGGSGVFVYLALVAMRDGQPVNLDTVLVGDRVQVRRITIADSRIRLDLLERDPGNSADPADRTASQIWRFTDGRLVRDDGTQS